MSKLAQMRHRRLMMALTRHWNRRANALELLATIAASGRCAAMEMIHVDSVNHFRGNAIMLQLSHPRGL